MTTTYLHSACLAASNALKGLASLIEPQSPSSAQPTARTTHCSTCKCLDMPSDVLEEDWRLLRDENGQRWVPHELREQARQAADEFMTHRGANGGIDDSKNLRVFSLYASQLDKWLTNHDFGVSYLTEAVGPDERSIALAAARYVSKRGRWPDRATAIRELKVKDPFLCKHLEGIEATYKQEAIQWAGRVEAGTDVESVPGTNDGDQTMRNNSSRPGSVWNDSWEGMIASLDQIE